MVVLFLLRFLHRAYRLLFGLRRLAISLRRLRLRHVSVPLSILRLISGSVSVPRLCNRHLLYDNRLKFKAFRFFLRLFLLKLRDLCFPAILYQRGVSIRGRGPGRRARGRAWGRQVDYFGVSSKLAFLCQLPNS